MNASNLPCLTTDRLQLRMPADGDASALLALYGNAQVMRYWSHAPWTALEQARAAIAEAHLDLATGRALHLVIALRADGALAGSCALFDLLPQHRCATLGYLLSPAHWGKGLGLEALRALTAHGFCTLGLQRIEAEVDPRNGASQALLGRLGFRRDGRAHARWSVAGEVRDVDLWTLMRRDRLG